MLLLTQAARCGASAEQDTLKQGGVTIEHSRHQRFLAERCLQTIAETRPRLKEELGLALPDEFTVKLFTSTQAYAQFVAGRVHPHSWGVAFPYAGLIAVNASPSALATDKELAGTLRHELVHLAIGRLEQDSGRGVPLWFNEGLAVWFSRQNLLELPRILKRAAVTGALIELQDLQLRFPTERAALSLAYEQCESVVGYLARKAGPGVFARVFERMRGGESFEEALRGATGGCSLEELQRRWRSSLKAGFWDWLGILSGISLFMVLAMLLVMAYLIMKWRARRTLRRWAEEEGEEYEPRRRERAEVDEDFDHW